MYSNKTIINVNINNIINNTIKYFKKNKYIDKEKISYIYFINNINKPFNKMNLQYLNYKFIEKFLFNKINSFDFIKILKNDEELNIIFSGIILNILTYKFNNFKNKETFMMNKICKILQNYKSIFHYKINKEIFDLINQYKRYEILFDRIYYELNYYKKKFEFKKIIFYKDNNRIYLANSLEEWLVYINFKNEKIKLYHFNNNVSNIYHKQEFILNNLDFYDLFSYINLHQKSKICREYNRINKLFNLIEEKVN